MRCKNFGLCRQTLCRIGVCSFCLCSGGLFGCGLFRVGMRACWLLCGCGLFRVGLRACCLLRSGGLCTQRLTRAFRTTVFWISNRPFPSMGEAIFLDK